MDGDANGLTSSLDGTRQFYRRVLENWGITIRVSEIPEFLHYAELRDRLELMHPVRRWLSWRLRRELKERRYRAEGALVDAVLTQAERKGRELAEPDR